MHLKKLVTRNFRLLENFEIEFNPEVTVLIGPNYTGKSSVIDAILFLRDAAIPNNFQTSFGARDGFARLVSWHDLSRNLRLETILSDGAGSFSYAVEFDSQGLRDEQGSLNGSRIWSTLIQQSNVVAYSAHDRLVFQTGRDFSSGALGLLPSTPPELVPLRQYFSSIVNVDPFRNVNFQGAVGPKEMIQATGADLPQVLHHHYNNDRDNFDAFERHQGCIGSSCRSAFFSAGKFGLD